MRRSKSSKELVLYNLLVNEFGKKNVTWSYKIDRYLYDFLLFKNILIEYDGYYWHTFLKQMI